jgi:hypothetical protein
MGIALVHGGHAMVEKQGWESEAVAPGQSGGSRRRDRASLLAGAVRGVALVAALVCLACSERQGHVVFRVQPEDASVWLYRGQERHQLEPVTGSLTATLPAGAHRAEVEREGYTSRELELDVKGGEIRVIDVILERAVGTVIFAVEPQTARVEFVSSEETSPAQNVPLTEGRWEGELEVGSYVARVDASGYHGESEPFEVRAGEPTVVAVSLRAIPPASSRGGARTVVVPAPVPVPGYGRIYAPGPPVVRGPRLPGPPVPRGPRLPGPPVPRGPRLPGAPGVPGPGLPGAPRPPLP